MKLKELTPLRKIIVKNTSEMLDHPDKYGIYPTTTFYNNLERDINDYMQKHIQELTKETFLAKKEKK